METLTLPFIGKTLPDMSLAIYHDDKEKNMRLAAYRGQWLVIFFYPADFTFVCPTELTDLANYYTEFAKRNAEIISVSTDTVYAHKAWHDISPSIRYIRFPMAADPTGGLCKLLGTYIPEEGISLRATCIIDPDGVIRAYEVQDNSIGRSAGELLRKLDALTYVRTHGDEVCPANWKAGDTTLTPDIELVGKI